MKIKTILKTVGSLHLVLGVLLINMLIFSGGVLGQLQVLTGEASIFTVEARAPSKVACLSRQVVNYEQIEKNILN